MNLHDEAQLRALSVWDKRLASVGKKIKVLTTLEWDDRVGVEFLKNWDAGKPKLPEIKHPKISVKEELRELKTIMDGVDRAHPVGNYIFQTAESYYTAGKMLEAIGTPAFTELSIKLYGKPSDHIASDSVTHLEAATHFIEVTSDFIDAYSIPEGALCLSAEQVAEEIERVLVPFFKNHEIQIVVDSSLTSKAAASSQRIRLRGSSCFSALDSKQLIHHEGFVHMLTLLNGRSQPNLPSMGLGSPRTTRSQEGLATFAELITSSIDLSRLQRIALRIRGVHMALEGADFVQVFRYFLETGGDQKESYQSTVRVFRGGDPKGRVAFTKDVVYLQGLIMTHTFLRKAVQANKFYFADYLFAGRMTLGDAVSLEPFFRSGFIQMPLYEPPWLQRRECLAAYLCYAVFANRIALGNIALEDFVFRQI